MKALNNTEINENIRMCSSDIKNMYTNIPQQELPDIIKAALKNSNMNYGTFVTDTQNLIQVIFEQNYFQYNG
jgi:ABC-type molybdenum transport system ATPase subunit/photorepair protein PhrA